MGREARRAAGAAVAMDNIDDIDANDDAAAGSAQPPAANGKRGEAVQREVRKKLADPSESPSQFFTK